MYSDEIVNKSEPHEIEIHPLSKWRRILTFLADYFLSFILGFLFLNLVISPIFSFATKANVRGEQMRTAQADRESVLYGNKLLFYENDIETNKNYSANLKYTFDRFLSYYVLDEQINNYGPVIENEIFYHFYVDIRNNKEVMIDNYNKQNTGYGYFILDETKTTSFLLKDDIKEELHLYFVYKDEELSAKGKTYLDDLANFFTIIYKAMLDDIGENDLTYQNISYIEKQNEYQNLVNYDHWIMTTCMLLSYLPAWAIIHLVIPLVNKTGKTIGMMILKAERVDYKHLSTFKKGDIALTSSYFFFLDLSYIFFLPLSFSSSGFIYVLSLPLIPLFSLLSLVLVIISFIILMINSFNRSLSDLTSQSILVNQDDLDAIYRYKGYHM